MLSQTTVAIRPCLACSALAMRLRPASTNSTVLQTQRMHLPCAPQSNHRRSSPPAAAAAAPLACACSCPFGLLGPANLALYSSTSLSRRSASRPAPGRRLRAGPATGQRGGRSGGVWGQQRWWKVRGVSRCGREGDGGGLTATAGGGGSTPPGAVNRGCGEGEGRVEGQQDATHNKQAHCKQAHYTSSQ